MGSWIWARTEYIWLNTVLYFFESRRDGCVDEAIRNNKSMYGTRAHCFGRAYLIHDFP